MQRIVDFFFGTCRLTLKGPWPLRTINHMSDAGVPFWDLRDEDGALHFVIYRRDLPGVKELCERDGSVLYSEVFGFRHRMRGLKGRYVLLSVLPVVFVMVLFLQNFIWYLQVEGNETLCEEQVLQALESIGIAPGTYVRTIDGQQVKNHMLALLPELEWISVNKHGGWATVLVKERRQTPEVTDPHLISNVVACRAGVISDMQVYSGFAVTEVGDSVLQGELLVSGLGSSWNAVVCRNAQADVYAYTRHETQLILPEESAQADFTGEEKSSWSLIVGKKRWNFFSNSGISLTGYDKIERVYQFALPGGISFPISLVKTICRTYEPIPTLIPEEQAKSLLQQAEKDCVAARLAAGVILDTQQELILQDGLWRLHAVSSANEMIAQTVMINPWSNEEFE